VTLKNKLLTLSFLLSDFIFSGLAWSVTHYFYSIEGGEANSFIANQFGNNFYLVVASIWVFLYAFSGKYVDLLKKSRVKDIGDNLKLSITGVVFVWLFFVINKHDNIFEANRSFLLAYFTIQFIILSVVRALLLSFYKFLVSKGKFTKNTIIIGSDARTLELLKELKEINYSLGFNLLGYFQYDEDENEMEGHLSTLGKIYNIKDYLSSNEIEQVIISINPSDHKTLIYLIGVLSEYPTIKVSILSDVFYTLLGSSKLNHIQGVPLIELKTRMMPVWEEILKRVFDFTFSLSVLIIGFPFLLFFALMTKFTSKGPIFYKQVRVGLHKNPFVILKFRSMYTDAEKFGPALSKDNDPRITPWGRIMRKTRIDELPQFINVLMGDMSIVGPRPERKFFIDKIQLRAPYYNLLFKAKPGITSLGQVKYGYAQNVDEMIKRLHYDLNYIENMSLSMDIRIMIMTVLVMIQGRGK